MMTNIVTDGDAFCAGKGSTKQKAPAEPGLFAGLSQVYWLVPYTVAGLVPSGRTPARAASLLGATAL